MTFYNCLDRQEQGDLCCNQSENKKCREVCLSIFRSYPASPTKDQRDEVTQHCEHTTVHQCAKEFMKVTPVTNMHNYLRCCDSTNRNRCRDTCKSVLSTKRLTTIEDIMNELDKEECGPPLFQDPLWQCFLKEHNVSPAVEVSTIDKVGMDSAKWHCCQRASSNQCKNLCSKTFTKDWADLWQDFHNKCLSQLSEERLRSCIDEVDEPCELGCDGLSFCTNFNNRPTELFRACTPQADEAARNDVTMWQTQHQLSLPGLTLPLKNISKCSPDTWKAVACILQIKPCSRYSHSNQICRDVCLEILTDCADWTKIPPEFSPEGMCSRLSPDELGASCITLQNYLFPSDASYQNGQVSSPCKNDPCGSSQICSINKNYSPGKSLPYTCTPGCKLGEVSEYMVPIGTYIRIPLSNNPKRCLQICKCTIHGIQECQPVPCMTLSPCWMGNSYEKAHGTNFAIECNTCSCYVSEVICSKKQCETTSISGKNTAYTTLPCNCPPHYVPVCGRNGNIYPSACLAKCAELSDGDIEYEACPDPCRSNPCPIGHKCVPDPKVCLTLMDKPCQQYQCVNGNSKCELIPKEPVCDINNQQFDNACFLAHSNKKLAYRGPCLKNCENNWEVCGINGRTYASECAAWSDYTSVDYRGPCIAVGLITDKKKNQCPGIKCKPLPDPNCLGFTPPGACCPICGGTLRLLYSRKQIDRALYVLHNKDTYSLTLKAMLQALARTIQVSQCALRGYLTVEMDIFVIVETTEKKPSQLQLEACIREAEKIASLVNTQSPRVVSELSLSSLVLATPVHTQNNYASNSMVVHSWMSFIVVVISFLVFR
ncbi:serine protease inhibitor [Holotrichia oblita]|uniref:Serine protease inhibitor n=2 Tax=Holotrichia oblita TaxID=644536 RepID=A0ACB9SMZ4_HOLOL|nr:serine protease inhibitor [Holotrichia oblita]KAI4456352.1 serine protease inhibitor [Holotrichia oblita]